MTDSLTKSAPPRARRFAFMARCDVGTKAFADWCTRPGDNVSIPGVEDVKKEIMEKLDSVGQLREGDVVVITNVPNMKFIYTKEGLFLLTGAHNHMCSINLPKRFAWPNFPMDHWHDIVLGRAKGSSLIPMKILMEIWVNLKDQKYVIKNLPDVVNRGIVESSERVMIAFGQEAIFQGPDKLSESTCYGKIPYVILHKSLVKTFLNLLERTDAHVLLVSGLIDDDMMHTRHLQMDKELYALLDMSHRVRQIYYSNRELYGIVQNDLSPLTCSLLDETKSLYPHTLLDVIICKKRQYIELVLPDLLPIIGKNTSSIIIEYICHIPAVSDSYTISSFYTKEEVSDGMSKEVSDYLDRMNF